MARAQTGWFNIIGNTRAEGHGRNDTGRRHVN